MKITIITLYRHHTADKYTTAVLGALSAEQQQSVATSYKLTRNDDDDVSDLVGFVVVDASDSVPNHIDNAFPDDATFEAGPDGQAVPF